MTSAVRRFPIILVALLSACGAPSPEDLLSQARQALADNEARTAEIHLRNLLRSEPGHLEGRMLLAEASLRAGNAPVAEENARRAIEAGSDPERMQLVLLQALSAQGKSDEVLAELATGPSIGDEYARQLMILEGRAHHELGNFEAAEQRLLAALALDPESLETRTLLAAMLQETNRLDEAEELIAGVLRLDPQNLVALLIQASLDIRSGRGDEAETILRQIADLEAVPEGSVEHLMALSMLIELQLSRGEIGAASSFADILLRSSPSEPNALLLKASVEVEQGELDAAERRMRLLIADVPEYWPAYRLLGSIDARQGQFNQAEMYLVAATNNDDELARLQLAELYVRQGRIDRARELFGEIGASGPRDALFLALAGGASLQVGRPGLAASFFDQIENLPGGDSAQLADIMRVFIAAGEFERAIRLVDSADYFDPEDRLAADSLIAMMHLRQGDAAAATAIADDLQDAYPDVAGPYVLRGAIAIAESDVAAARSFFESAVEIDARNVRALLNLAGTCVLEGDLSAARGYYERVAAIDEDESSALFGLSTIALRQGDLETARSWLARTPRSSLRYQILGSIEAASGDVPSAVNAFTEAYEIEPSLELATRLLRVKSRTGQADADRQLRDWLTKHPDDAEAHNVLGSYMLTVDDIGQAVASFETAIRIDPNHVVSLNNLAWLYMDRGDQRALEYAERAYAGAPDNAAVVDTLGWVQYQDGNLERAFELLQKAATAAPDVADIQYHWAVVLAASGDEERGRGIVAGLLEDPDFSSREEAEEWLESRGI